jgi:hypothetical protein
LAFNSKDSPVCLRNLAFLPTRMCRTAPKYHLLHRRRHGRRTGPGRRSLYRLRDVIQQSRLVPSRADCTTQSASSSVTDSAAAGTALATGVKVNNGVISMAAPGNGAQLQTLLEYFKHRANPQA